MDNVKIDMAFKEDNIKIGSRDSELAVKQAQQVMELITRPTELITMKTTGDMVLDKTLDKVGGKGLFVKELDQALIDKRVDFTVHSLKDVPMDLPKELPLLAFPVREDVRDVLVLPKGTIEHDLTKPIGCSSARRRIQLKRLFPHTEIKPIRGNLLTRLNKLDNSGEFGALVLAAAGLHRLGLKDRISRYFTIEEILPAAGQGILALQGRNNYQPGWLERVDHPEIHSCAIAERTFVRAMGGGCFAPIAAYARIEHDLSILLCAMYAIEEKNYVCYASSSAPFGEAEELGKRVAKDMLCMLNDAGMVITNDTDAQDEDIQENQ